jgi:CRP/FNR family transcriptional regulator
MEISATATTASHSVHRQAAVGDRAHADPLQPLLRQACQPGALSAAAASALAAVAFEERLPAGTPVLSRDQAAVALWLVARGSVALGLRCGGALQQRRSVEAGEWLDLGSALLHGRYSEDAEAQTNAVVWQLPLQAVLRCAQVHPSVMPALATALAAQVRGLIDGTRALMTKDVLGRCASWLLAHAEIERGADGRLAGRLRLQQRKRAVAQELGTTAETFSRTLRQLSRDGLIEVQGYSITLLQVEALQQLADPAAG